MQPISHFQIRGVPGLVNSCSFEGRRVDYWSPRNPTHLLIAHDGQNIFDPRSATRRRTWKMAQTAIKIFETKGLTPPAIIGIFHSSTKSDPHGRFKDLTPQGPFEGKVPAPVDAPFPISELRGNEYQQLIAETIVPSISDALNINVPFENRAMIGSSMGGLATLNALTLRKDFFRTALAFSPHWIIGGSLLVEEILRDLPNPGVHKIWMSRGDKKLDAQYKFDQDFADQRLHNLGWGKSFKSTVYKGAGHNEGAWAKQLAEALHFWLSD